MILPEIRNIIPVSYQVSNSSFFAVPPRKRFANLSEQELNQLVEQINRSKALSTRRRTKKQQTVLYQPFEVSNALREF